MRMPILKYNDQSFEGIESETILDCLIRNNQVVPNSCRSGVCQSCMLKTNSTPDLSSQKGLSPSKRESGLFLSCQQKLNKDFEVFKPNESSTMIEGEIISQDRISSSVVLVSIKVDADFNYYAGQFVNIFRGDGLCRSYSLASQSNDKTLQLHVRKVLNGEMSNWLYNSELIGQKIKLSGPIGECYLNQDMFNDDLLLLGVGTGLAPLFGIIKDAISKGFQKKITLFHGGLTREGLYLVEDLKILEEQYSQFNYNPIYLNGDEREGFIKGNILELLKDLSLDKLNTSVMVCGDPEMVKRMKQTIFMKGIPSKKILSDSFITVTTNSGKIMIT